MTETQRRLRRVALLIALTTAGVLIVGAQAASAQVIEICKSSSNGMSGRQFSYTVAPSGGSSFSVGPIAGGRCSGPINVSGASATITEDQSDPATDVKSVTVRPSARKTSEDLGNRRVTVVTGASTASETLVTFTNQPAGGNYGTLKVCKLTETPAYLGRQFSFSVNGGPLRLHGGQRRVRRSGQLHLPHPGHVPGRLGRRRARAGAGWQRGAVDRHRPG